MAASTSDTAAAGTYSLSGSGLLSATQEYVGNSESGSFTQSGGTNAVLHALPRIRRRNGTYNLSGSGLLTATQEYIGSSGNGSFAQSGGTNPVTTLYLG